MAIILHRGFSATVTYSWATNTYYGELEETYPIGIAVAEQYEAVILEIKQLIDAHLSQQVKPFSACDIGI